MSRKTWIIDGGPTRFVIVGLAALLALSVITVSVLFVKFLDLRETAQNSAANNPFFAGQSATVETGDADVPADRPDPLAAARDGLSRWLNGDTSALSPDAVVTLPTAPVGGAVADGGALVQSGDSYAAADVPLTIGQVQGTATVELVWNGTAWAITNIVVS